MDQAFVYAVIVDGEIVYVGRTNNLVKRHREHRARINAANASPKKLYARLRTAINWDLVEIDRCPPEDVVARETFWIRYHGTHKSPGCNSRDDGVGGREEGCENPSGEQHYLHGKNVARHVVEASIAARTGKHLSEEHAAKISAGIRASISHKQKRAVISEDGREFGSLHDAARSLGVNANAIMQALKLGTNCSGRRWRYSDSDFVAKAPNKRIVGITCVETGEVFASLEAACKAHGVPKSSLSRHVSTGEGTVRGRTYQRSK